MTEIVRDDAVLGGEPCIEGTRIGVLDVARYVVDSGFAPAEAADQLDRSLGEIYTALAYYYEHPEEMRQLRQERAETREALAAEGLQPPEAVQ